MKFCTHCGNELMDEAVICPKCGCPADDKSGYGRKNEKLALKKKLTLFQIAVILISAFLPFSDQMFNWSVWNILGEYVSNSNNNNTLSLYNLMTIQEIRPGPIVFWIFFVSLGIMLAYCILELFAEDRLRFKKVAVGIPAFSLALDLLMTICSDTYRDSFTRNGELRFCGVSLNVLAYVEIVLLLVTTIVELYKQRKCEE